MDALAQLRKILDEAGGEGDYSCPVCWYRMKTHEEKTKHLEHCHGYETLQIEPCGPLLQVEDGD